MRRLLGYLGFIALITWGIESLGASLEQSAIMEINEKAKNIRSYTCEIEVRKGDAIETTGKILFKTSPPREKGEFLTRNVKWFSFTTDDKEIMYIPDIKLAFIDRGNGARAVEDPEHWQDQALPGIPSTVYVEAQRAPEGSSADEKYLVSIIANQPSESFDEQDIPSKVEILYNKDYGYIEQVLLRGFKGQLLQAHTMKNYRLNVNINDKEFTFNPPADCQIVDKTKGSFSLGITKEMGEILKKKQSEGEFVGDGASEYRQDSNGNWYRVPKQTTPEQPSKKVK